VVGSRSTERRRPFGVDSATPQNGLAGYLTPLHSDLTGVPGSTPRDSDTIPVSAAERLFTPTATTLAFLKAGYNVGFEPNSRPRVGKSKIRFVSDGAKFLLIVLRVITIFSPLRIFAPVSLVALALGGSYGVWTIVRYAHVTNSSVLLIILGVLVFLLGVISEQISALRFEDRDR
jgi:hypothetical protein